MRRKATGDNRSFSNEKKLPQAFSTQFRFPVTKNRIKQIHSSKSATPSPRFATWTKTPSTNPYPTEIQSKISAATVERFSLFSHADRLGKWEYESRDQRIRSSVRIRFEFTEFKFDSNSENSISIEFKSSGSVCQEPTFGQFPNLQARPHYTEPKICCTSNGSGPPWISFDRRQQSRSWHSDSLVNMQKFGD